MIGFILNYTTWFAFVLRLICGSNNDISPCMRQNYLFQSLYKTIKIKSCLMQKTHEHTPPSPTKWILVLLVLVWAQPLFCIESNRLPDIWYSLLVIIVINIQSVKGFSCPHDLIQIQWILEGLMFWLMVWELSLHVSHPLGIISQI